MKQKKLSGLISVLIIVFLTGNNLFAQNGNTNQNQNQVKNQIKNQSGNQFQNKVHGIHFIDLNNDGYNDNAPDADGDGIPNGQDPDYTRQSNGKGVNYMGDKNGNGYGYKHKHGTGVCNGTGPKGNKRNNRR